MLEPGDQVPPFRLRALDGTEHTLEDLTSQGPVLLAFYKGSCPICQYTFPFLERVKNNGRVRLVAVSQDDPESTREFLEDFGVTFLTLLDPYREGYPLSNGCRITHVPSLLEVEPGGRVAHSWSGFSRADMEALGQRAGAPVFAANESVPAFRPG